MRTLPGRCGVAAALCLAAGLAAALPAGGRQDDLVKIDGAVMPRRLSRGEQGRVALRLGVREGILLYAQPSFVVEFIPQPEIVFPKNFFTASELKIETEEIDGGTYLVLKKAVEIPFTIDAGAQSGSHILEGKIKYFARSQKDGWCLKSAAKFSIPYSTRAAVVRAP